MKKPPFIINGGAVEEVSTALRLPKQRSSSNKHLHFSAVFVRHAARSTGSLPPLRRPKNLPHGNAFFAARKQVHLGSVSGPVAEARMSSFLQPPPLACIEPRIHPSRLSAALGAGARRSEIAALLKPSFAWLGERKVRRSRVRRKLLQRNPTRMREKKHDVEESEEGERDCPGL